MILSWKLMSSPLDRPVGGCRLPAPSVFNRIVGAMKPTSKGVKVLNWREPQGREVDF
jgi:hypothetical protein